MPLVPARVEPLKELLGVPVNRPIRWPASVYFAMPRGLDTYRKPLRSSASPPNSSRDPKTLSLAPVVENSAIPRSVAPKTCPRPATKPEMELNERDVWLAGVIDTQPFV